MHFGVILANGSAFITEADIPNDAARCPRLDPSDSRERTLSGAITHEITHRLIRRKIGFWANRKVPRWILEGYCDFIAQDDAIDPELGMAIFRRLQRPVPGCFNFRGRILVEHLIKVEGLSIDELPTRPPEDREVGAEVLAHLGYPAAGS